MGKKIKLVSFQSIDALKELLENGYLECNEKKIDSKKYGYVYNWIIEKMNIKTDNKYKTKYPLWCWVKCYNGICPPKRKGEKTEKQYVKITFYKNEKDVFITDYRRYSFLLSNQFIPNSLKEKELFDKELKKHSISNEDLKAYVRKDKYSKCRTDKVFINTCDKIRESFDRCITKDSDVLQGCIWRIDLNEIEKIEILKDDGYIYGSLNYIRSNGKRFNWQNDYYKKLK